MRSDEIWTARAQARLIEMFRLRHTLEEIARELSLPLDEVQRRIERLELEEGPPRPYE